METSEAEARLREILVLAQSLRGSGAGILEGYASTVIAETRAALLHLSLLDPPERLTPAGQDGS